MKHVLRRNKKKINTQSRKIIVAITQLNTTTTSNKTFVGGCKFLLEWFTPLNIDLIVKQKKLGIAYPQCCGRTLCSNTYFFSFDVPSYVGTNTNEPRPPPLSSTNEERWTTAGSFVLILPLQSFCMAAIQMVAASPMCPGLGV
jgi:hypothetical protein